MNLLKNTTQLKTRSSKESTMMMNILNFNVFNGSVELKWLRFPDYVEDGEET